jgi:hypothetical protein
MSENTTPAARFEKFRVEDGQGTTHYLILDHQLKVGYNFVSQSNAVAASMLLEIMPDELARVTKSYPEIYEAMQSDRADGLLVPDTEEA